MALALLLASWAFQSALAFETPISADLSVDLHSHLFMKPGMGVLFTGEFDGPLRARDWRSRFASQVNPETLDRSGAGIVIVSLYAHGILAPNRRETVREEIRQAERFVATHPNWVIARAPREAREALARGQRVLVLSLEGASSALRSEEDLREFIDERGIRIVTFLHIVDTRYGGVASISGLQRVTNPRAWSLGKPVVDENGVQLNPNGLTAQGRALARDLIRRGVWIDLSHASDASARELTELTDAARLPPLYTHTVLRAFHRAERGLSDRQLKHLADHDGILGLVPSEQLLEDTHVGASNGGLPAFVEHYRRATSVMNPLQVMVGSDFNGAMPHLPPTQGTGTSLDDEGLWNAGQMQEFWRAARVLGAPVPARLSDQIETFLKAWERVHSERRLPWPHEATFPRSATHHRPRRHDASADPARTRENFRPRIDS